MQEESIPNFDSPQVYKMPLGHGVNCWQLESVSSECVQVFGYHGYIGFYTDFMITWVHDGEALATFNGYGSPGTPKIATFRLKIIATSAATGVQLLNE
jgi:hypothetical protein